MGDRLRVSVFDLDGWDTACKVVGKVPNHVQGKVVLSDISIKGMRCINENS